MYGFQVDSKNFNSDSMKLNSARTVSFNFQNSGNDIYSFNPAPFPNSVFPMDAFNQDMFATMQFPMFNFPTLAPFKTRQSVSTNYKKVPLSQECRAQIDSISQKINCDPKDLEKLIYAESGGKASAVNRSSGATGLIQFMPKTARSLGTSTDQLADMSAEKQMKYVEKYLVQTKKNAGLGSTKLDSGTLYSLVFSPARAKQEIQYSAGTLAYSLNNGLDKNRDGRITKSELAERIA